MSQGNPETPKGPSQVKEIVSTHPLLVPSNATFIIETLKLHYEPSEYDAEDIALLHEGLLIFVDYTITLDVFGDGEQLIIDKTFHKSLVEPSFDIIEGSKLYRSHMENAAVAWFSLDA